MTSSPSPRPLDLGDLKAISVLGRGAKGVVFHVRSPVADESLALKAISRSFLDLKASSSSSGADAAGGDAYRRIWFERDVLLALRHPLFPSLRGVVSTDKIVGFAIDRCSGGDLNSLRMRKSEKMFSDDVIRFYAAEMVLGLEYLHGLGIVYRDLKPHNVLIQDTGHLMLVDFDLSTKLPSRPPYYPPKPSPPPVVKKKRRRMGLCFSSNSGVSPDTSDSTDQPSPPPGSAPEKSNSFVGTEEYVAPEIIIGNGHDFAVDWWSLGILLYEMLYGRSPFRGQNRKETFYRILKADPDLVGKRTPLRDLIARLLEKDPDKRIRCEEVKRHEFFRGVDWEYVVDIARPPFIPSGAEWEEEGENGGIDVEKLVQEVFGNSHNNNNNNENNNNNDNSKVEEGVMDPSIIVEFSDF
ncbi:serine/threonine-protein kinase OXI1-like [Typha latifolia]|uniref:serine/threonine-protein kinase OXI1-like n=1 Tax=Typha latifolia TaxID=4733 RepID=UPI003C2EABA8